MSKDLLQVFIEDLQKILTDKKLTSKIKVTGDEEIDLLIKQTQLLLTEVQKRDDRIALQKNSSKYNYKFIPVIWKRLLKN